MNADKIEEAITDKTKAILPVQLTGDICDMDKILETADKYALHVIEDACQSVSAEYKGKRTGSFGTAGAFSMHPLKNLNVWGDAGFITTNSQKLYEDLLLWRNHGLKNRDECEFYAYNSRISTFQAAVALHLIDDLGFITEKRIENAKFYDMALKDIPQIKLPSRSPDKKHVYHVYIIQAEKRDDLVNYLNREGVETKIHYPIPLHLQKATQRLNLGYKEGDFPATEEQAKSILSLPIHQYLTNKQREYVVEKIKDFYKK